MTRFVFVNPPFTELESFPLQMIGVASRLERLGHEVEVADANSACFRSWLDAPFLRGQMARMERVAQRLGTESELAAEDAYLLHRAVRGTVGGDRLLSAIDGALRTIDKPRSKRVLESALDVALWPARGVATLNDLTLAASTERIADIVAMASAPPDANRFLRFWQAWLEDRRFEEPETLVLWIEADQQIFPAFTLARLLRKRGRFLRVVLAGPFASFLRRASGSRWWSAYFDDIAPAFLEANEDLPARWLLEELASERLLGEPKIVSVTPYAIDAVRTAFPNALLHVNEPQRVESLLRIVGGGARLSAMVKFGFDLDGASASALRDSGFETLHFEVKGHAGYGADEACARATMQASFRAAREAGMTTLATLVYGYPADRQASFARFVSAFASEKDAVDRWVRMKIYRLYRFSEAWSRPQSLGIATRFAPPHDRELARHVAFTTASGLDSRRYSDEARAALAIFGRRPHDFPRSPILSDDAFLRTERSIRKMPTIPQDAWLESTRDGVRAVPFSFADLDATFGSYVPGPDRHVPNKRFARSDSFLARSAEGDAIKMLHGGVLKLLDACAEPRPASDLLARVDPRVMSQLVGLGLVRVKEAAHVHP